jgi:hypothetical protein
MNPSNAIEKLDSAMNAFLIPLRMGEGFDSEKFEIACAALKEFSLDWEQKPLIPKKAAILFLDDLTSMVSCSYLYPSQTSFIQEKADTLHELVRKCCEEN